MKLPNIFRTVFFSGKKEEMLPEDKANIESFVTSLWCKSVEKNLRNRIVARNQSLIYAVKEGNVAQAAVFASQMEELEDIMSEWNNIRSDVERNARK